MPTKRGIRSEKRTFARESRGQLKRQLCSDGTAGAPPPPPALSGPTAPVHDDEGDDALSPASSPAWTGDTPSDGVDLDTQGSITDSNDDSDIEIDEEMLSPSSSASQASVTILTQKQPPSTSAGASPVVVGVAVAPGAALVQHTEPVLPTQTPRLTPSADIKPILSQALATALQVNKDTLAAVKRLLIGIISTPLIGSSVLSVATVNQMTRDVVPVKNPSRLYR